MKFQIILKFILLLNLVENGKTQDEMNVTSTSTTEIPETETDMEEDFRLGWKIKDCLFFSGNISFTFEGMPPLQVPSKAVATGNCSDYTNTLKLSWESNQFTMLFLKKLVDFQSGSGEYGLSAMFGTVGQHPVQYRPTNKFLSAAINSTFQCNSDLTLDLGRGNSVLFQNVQLEAFGTTNNGNSSDLDSSLILNQTICPEDALNVGAIIGGVVFAIIVLILLGALLYRRYGYTRLE